MCIIERAVVKRHADAGSAELARMIVGDSRELTKCEITVIKVHIYDRIHPGQSDILKRRLPEYDVLQVALVEIDVSDVALLKSVPFPVHHCVAEIDIINEALNERAVFKPKKKSGDIPELAFRKSAPVEVSPGCFRKAQPFLFINLVADLNLLKFG